MTSTIEVAMVVDATISTTIDSFDQVGGENTACRSRPKSNSDDDYYDRYFSSRVIAEALYQNRPACEAMCVNSDECFAYEFQELGVEVSVQGASEMRGVCEMWRIGPVFESSTDGPLTAGGSEPPATGYTCWLRVPGGLVKSASIDGCPISIVALGVYAVGACVAILVVVCCVCQVQRKRTGDITIDQSGFVPQANVDPSTPSSALSPEQVNALRVEREALEAALGVSPQMRDREPTSGAELQSRLDAVANAQRGEEEGNDLDDDEQLRPAAAAERTPVPPSGPLPPVSARPPASPRPMGGLGPR